MRPAQRLIGLYLLYEIYLHENVKTTPFYQLVLDLLSRRNKLHVAEQKLLTDFLQSVPRIAKHTPAQYIRDAEHAPPAKELQDLEPYRKAHIENMPTTLPLPAAALSALLPDVDEVSVEIAK